MVPDAQIEQLGVPQLTDVVNPLKLRYNKTKWSIAWAVLKIETH